MRDDIAKVIVERPRRGGAAGRHSKQYRREVDWSRLLQEGREEDSPSREHIRRKWGWDRKEFSDFLAPVYGFLRKSVGRPWDDVWSEISSRLSVGSTVQRHVLGHVFDYVELHAVELEDGTIASRAALNRGFTWFSSDFYVCPRTGELRMHPDSLKTRKSRWRWTPELPVVRFHKRSGIWYEVDFARSPVTGKGWRVAAQTFTSLGALNDWFKAHPSRELWRGFVKEVDLFSLSVTDALLGRMAAFAPRDDRAGHHWLDAGDLYCATKRQVGRRDIRRFGLHEIESDHAGPPAKIGG